MRNTPSLRRWVQIVALAFFCLLLVRAGQGGLWGLPADAFLRLDPLAGLTVPLAVRGLVAALTPALLVYCSAVLLGRVFCGWICPMGTTLDAAGALARVGCKRQNRRVARFRPVKFVLLAAVLLVAALGVNMAFWLSPLPLTARLYVLVLYPLAATGMDNMLSTAMPLMERWGPDALRYWQPDTHTFATAGFVALFWGVCAALERVSPRFWCRHICPAGALLALLSRFAPWRRRVDAPACVSCGQCAVACPVDICQGSPEFTRHGECLACRSCERHCRIRAIRFGLPDDAGAEPVPSPRIPSRRAFCGSLAAGAVLAGMARLAAPTRISAGTPVVRPPGSVPEDDFLARCLRCGACMQACPTGGLQPLWLEAACSAMFFSPILAPRSGPCRPECTACGHVCPSRAILPLPPEEKRWAKMGTAVIHRKACLAWAEEKRCMVCMENCPYGAVEVRVLPGQAAPVPIVRVELCYGCGYCEKFCPLPLSAITVNAEGALRLVAPEFESAARARGLRLGIGKGNAAPGHAPMEQPAGLPPGFLE